MEFVRIDYEDPNDNTLLILLDCSSLGHFLGIGLDGLLIVNIIIFGWVRLIYKVKLYYSNKNR